MSQMVPSTSQSENPILFNRPSSRPRNIEAKTSIECLQREVLLLQKNNLLMEQWKLSIKLKKLEIEQVEKYTQTELYTYIDNMTYYNL